MEASADGYIPFEPARTSWKRELRDEIRSRCRLLEPSAGEVLHATFFGDMPRRADVENLVLYNIDQSFDSFNCAGSNGIRFEHGGVVPPLLPRGASHPFGYRYAFAQRDNEFLTAWKPGRSLASFDWTDLGAFAGGKKLAQVWLALARGDAKVFVPVIAPDTKFAVKVAVRPPRGKSAVLGKLVKPIFDGVICAFQAHAGTEDLSEISERLAKDLPAHSEDLRRYLRDQSRAVLGSVLQLFFLHGAGVKGNPSDDLCLAGELLPAEPIDDRWAIRGEVIEISR